MEDTSRALSSADRMAMESNVLKYFSHTQFMNKKVVAEERYISKFLGDQWGELPLERKEALLNLLHVDDEVRALYQQEENQLTQYECLPESFPRLFINSGQKINVDFENDLWTWRDEHSGPFSWMSRSQQDLTLADLEPDTISKPQPKSSKTDTDEEMITAAAEVQFTFPSNSWSHDILSEYKKQGLVALTPSCSDIVSVERDMIGVEEINPAFEGYYEEISAEQARPNHAICQLEKESEESQHASSTGSKHKGKDRGRKSPSPKKMFRSGSFKGSAAKKGDPKLIGGEDPDCDDDGINAFSNPAMESEWSTFVGGKNETSCESPRVSSMLQAPEVMTMDRGATTDLSSVETGDEFSNDVAEPPLQSEPKSGVSSPLRSDWSEESTPDHSTHLLKGLQSPVHQASKQACSIQWSSQTPSEETEESRIETESSQDMLKAAEVDEVLRVEVAGENITVTTDIENQEANSVPITGFDFLDNW